MNKESRAALKAVLLEAAMEARAAVPQKTKTVVRYRLPIWAKAVMLMLAATLAGIVLLAANRDFLLTVANIIK